MISRAAAPKDLTSGVTDDRAAAAGGIIPTSVIKQMNNLRAPEAFVTRFTELHRALPGVAPPLLRTHPGVGCWYAEFGWVNGTVLDPGAPDVDDQWSRSLDLLERLRDSAPAPLEWPLEQLWLDRLSTHPLGCAPAVVLLGRLTADPPVGRRTLAHGDFSGQNLLAAGPGQVLIDWEEIGNAPLGFDAGWTLALNRVGAGPRWAPDALFADLVERGFPPTNLRWFEALGLLRLLYRSLTLPLPPDKRSLVTHRVRSVITAYVGR